jgi:hypothetical protein
MNDLKELDSIFNSLELIENINEYGWTNQLDDLFGDELRANGIDTDEDIPKQLCDKININNEGFSIMAGIAFMIVLQMVIFGLIIICDKLYFSKLIKILKNNEIFENIKQENISNISLSDYDFILSYTRLSSTIKEISRCIKILLSNNTNVLLNINTLNKLLKYRHNIKRTLMDTKLEGYYSDGEVEPDYDKLIMEPNSLGEIGYTTANVLASRKELLFLLEFLKSISRNKKILLNRAKKVKTQDVTKEEFKACKVALRSLIKYLHEDIKNSIFTYSDVLKKTATIKYKRYKF